MQNKTLERYFHVLNFIQVAPKFKTIKVIHSHLVSLGDEMDIRTVQRIIEYFEDRFELMIRYSNDSHPAKEVAWSRQLGPPRFGEHDLSYALTFHLAAKLLAPIIPGAFLGDIKRELGNARKVLAQTNKSIKKLPEKIIVLPRGTGRLPNQVDAKILNIIYHAVLDEKQLNVDYHLLSESKNIRSIDIHPLGLIIRFDTLYLTLYRTNSNFSDVNDKLIEDWPIHRFIKVKTLNQTIEKPQDFDLSTHAQKAGFSLNTHTQSIYKLGFKFKICLLFKGSTTKYIIERPFSSDQRIKKQEDGRFLVTATVNNSRELLSELQSFSDDVEVIEPKALREYFKQTALNMCRQYSS